MYVFIAKLAKKQICFGSLSIYFSCEKAMENRAYDGYNPMKRLIERMPKVAEVNLELPFAIVSDIVLLLHFSHFDRQDNGLIFRLISLMQKKDSILLYLLCTVYRIIIIFSSNAVRLSVSISMSTYSICSKCTNETLNEINNR